MDPIVEIHPNGDIDVIYFLYTPSKPAAWAFVALFAIATAAHFVLMLPLRSAFFLPLIIGGIMEAFGYYGRAWAHDDSDSVKPWILQAMLIISAPPLISATVYMSLSRSIRALRARDNALMSPRAMTPLFVTADIVAFCSQIAGVGLQASTGRKMQDIGHTVVLAGLIFQLVLLAFFVWNIRVFHKRNARNPTTLTDHPQLPRWRRLIYVLYFIGTAIFVRNLVRAIEYAEGPKGTVGRNEAFVYIFDAALMFGSMTALMISHPGRLIKKAKRMDSVVANATSDAVKEGLGASRRLEA